MNKKQENINTYNKSAKSLAEKFNGLEGYPKEIKKVFSMISNKNPKVLEIGCGNGRDTGEILKYTNNYLGIDFSKELIKYAKKKNPGINFLIADFDKFVFPKNINAVFAFASLLHSDSGSLKKIFKKIHNSLTDNGLLFLSLKYGSYQEKIKIDEFGKRFFYFYNFKKLKEIAGRDFIVVWKELQNLRNQKWIDIILKKV